MTVKEAHEWSNIWNQFYATITANLIALSLGLTLGWAAPFLPILASEDTPLQSGPITNEQISWIGSFNCIGSIVGSIVFGYFTALLGCKRTILLLAVPSIAHWFLIYFGSHYHHILIAKFCDGLLLGGSTYTIMIYVSEIANDDIRGRLGAITVFFRNVGVLIAYILGSTVDYKYVPCICVIVPLVFLIAFSAFSNTPKYYLQKGNLNKAESALKHYKGYKEGNEQEANALYEEFDRMKSISMKQKTNEKLTLADFLNCDAMKGLGTGFALVLCLQSTASFPFICYAVLIFKTAGTSIDPYLSSIIFAACLIFGSLLSTYVADALGRKLTNFISLAGSAIGMFMLSAYQYFKLNGYDFSAYAWIPVVCLCFVIFISSTGIAPLLIVCSLECMPPKLRTFGLSTVTLFLSISGFISLKTFPLTMAAIGLHGCMLMYGCGCSIGAIFVLFVLKETQGVTIDDVEVKQKVNDETDLNKTANQPLISEHKV